MSSWRRCVVALALLLGCKSKAPPPPDDLAYRINVQLPDDAFLVLRDGVQESRVFDERGVRRFTISSERWLSDGSASLIVRQHSPCATKDVAIRFEGLDRAKESELRAKSREDREPIVVTGVTATPLADHPDAQVWVDWGGSERAKGAVVIGTLDLSTIQAPEHRPVYPLFDLSCSDARTVRLAGHVAGKLETPPPGPDEPPPLPSLFGENYLVTTKPEQCYRYKSIQYGTDGGTDPVHLEAGPIHPLEGRTIDYFLEPAPTSVEATDYSPHHDSRTELLAEPCRKTAR